MNFEKSNLVNFPTDIVWKGEEKKSLVIVFVFTFRLALGTEFIFIAQNSYKIC